MPMISHLRKFPLSWRFPVKPKMPFLFISLIYRRFYRDILLLSILHYLHLYFFINTGAEVVITYFNIIAPDKATWTRDAACLSSDNDYCSLFSHRFPFISSNVHRVIGKTPPCDTSAA